MNIPRPQRRVPDGRRLLATACLAGLVLGACRAAAPLAAEPDIVGGREADVGEWPWQVAILDSAIPDNFEGQYCGGALIDPEWVVTAAHCVEGLGLAGASAASTMEVGLGMHDLDAGDGRRVAVAQVVLHPDYQESDALIGDIALLRLAAPATESRTVKVVGPVEALDDLQIQPDATAWTTGWGQLDDGDLPLRLHEVDVPIVDEALCRVDGEDVDAGESLCAGAPGKDSCYGDSGGPLVVGSAGAWRLAGLVSGGTTEICGGPDNFSLYTSVPYYLDWIHETMAHRGPALELDVSAPRLIAAGQTYRYTIQVRNMGRGPAQDLVVTDPLPAGVTFAGASDGGRLDGEDVVWRLPTLGGGARIDLSLTVREDPRLAGGPISHADPAAWAESWTGDGPGEASPAEPRLEAGDGARPDVAGGRAAATGSWPGQLGLYTPLLGVEAGQICGATLVAPQWALTAAHCVYDEGLLPADFFEVMAGSTRLSDDAGQTLAVVDEVFLNARYLNDENADLALLRLGEPLPIGPRIAPVTLAGAADGALMRDGQEAVVTGWGGTDLFGDERPDALQEARLPIETGPRCAEQIDPAQGLCAGKPEGGASACFGDSGGPLMVDAGARGWLQVGITSGVTDDYCGSPGSLSLFTRTDAFKAWIEQKLAGGKQDKVIVNADLLVDATGMDPAAYYDWVVTVVDPLAAPVEASPTADPGPSATVPPSPGPSSTPQPATSSPTSGVADETGPAYLPRLGGS